jgi:hypothetical protein
MTSDTTPLFEELFRVIHNDELFHEFLSAIFNKNLTCLLRAFGGIELEADFNACIRKFFLSVNATRKHFQPPRLFTDLALEFGPLNASHLIISSQDCFPDVISLKSFSGFRKCVNYANASLTRLMVLVCLLPQQLRAYSFISDGFLPIPAHQTSNFETLERPKVSLKTLAECAVTFTVKCVPPCNVVLIVVEAAAKTFVARSRLGVKGCAHAALALPGNREYIIYPFSSNISGGISLTVGSLSGPNSCEFY